MYTELLRYKSLEVLIIGSRIHMSQLMRDIPNPSQHYSKCQTRGEKLEKWGNFKNYFEG